MRRSIAVLATAALLALAAAPGAHASSPPNGTYPCFQFISGTGLVGAGILRIHSSSTYSVNRGKKATYRTAGKKISFPAGPYKGSYRGKWARKKGNVTISLYRKGDTRYQRALLSCG